MLIKSKVAVEIDFDRKSISIANLQKATIALYLKGEELTTG